MRPLSAFMLYPRAMAEAAHVLAAVRAHPAVATAVVAGSLRRRNEVVRDIDVVAVCTTEAEQVAADFAGAPLFQSS